MVLLAALAVLFSMTRRLGAMDAITVTRPGDGVEVIAFRWANLATAVSYAVGRCIVSPAVLTRLATLDRRALQIGAFAVLAFVVGVAAVHGWRRPVVVTVLLLMMIGELALVLMARPFWNLAMEVPTMWQLPGRYLVFPICCALLSVVVILDGLAARWPRVAASAACAVVVALAWWPSFAIAPLPDLDWPYWAARLQAKLETGNRDPLVIPMNPGVFPIRFDTAPKP